MSKVVNIKSLKGAHNIGSTIAKYLNDIGIFSLNDLAKRTPAKAYNEIRDMHPHKTFPVCYYLYSLQGALLGMHWDDLPASIKDTLRQEAGI